MELDGKGREASGRIEVRGTRADRAATWLLLLYVCLLPLSWSPLPFNIQWADLLVPALLACTIAARPRFRLSGLDVLVLAYVLSSLASFVTTTEPRSGVVPFVKQAYLGLLYGIVAAHAGRVVPPAAIARWLAAVAAAIGIACVLALLAYHITGIAVPRFGVAMALPYLGEVYRLYGTFPSPEYLVSFLAFATPLAVVQIVRLDGRVRRLWTGATVAMVIAGLFTVGHGIVGLAAAATLILAWAWRDRPSGLVPAAVVATGALFLVVNVALIVAVREVRVVASRNLAAGQPAAQHALLGDERGDRTLGLEVTYNFMGYWRLKQLAWESFLRQPVSGIGLGAFHTETRRAISEGRLAQVYRDFDPHSTWLGRLAETGLIGTAALAALWVGVLAHARHFVAGSGPDAHVTAALAVGIVAVLVNSPNIDVMNFRFLWLAFGALRGVRVDG